MPLPTAFYSGELARGNRRHCASTSCDIAQHVRLPCRGRSNSEPPETGDLDIANITYFWDVHNCNRMRGVSKCPQPDMRSGTVWRRHGVGAGRHADVSWSRSAVPRPCDGLSAVLARPELMRVAPLGGLRARKHVAGTSVIGVTLTSGNCSQLFQPGHLALNGVSPTIGCHFHSVGVTGRDLHQPRLRWARMAEMVAVVASALPPPNGAKPAKPCVSASNCR
jgi:hypothetical protein